MRGQSSIEYVALMLVVSVVMAVGGGLVAAPGVANAVGRAVVRALCEVTGSGCPTVSSKPCVVRATTLRGGVSAKVVLLRVGRDSAIMRMERSDGTVDVTLLDNVSAGLKAALGARGRLLLGDRQLGVGVIGEAALVATLGGGRTWRVRGRAAADRLVGRLKGVLVGRTVSSIPVAGPLIGLGQRILRKGAHARLPEPDSRTQTGGVMGEARALLGPLDGTSGSVGALLGRRRDRDGSTTWFVRMTGDAGMPLASALGLDAGAHGELQLALGYDARGHLESLTVGGHGSLTRSATFAGVTPGARIGDGHRVQVWAVLDLRDSDDRARALDVVRSLAPARVARLPRAVVALAGAIADHAAIDVTTYREQRRAVGFNVEAGVGATVGVGAELTRTNLRLTGAWWRPPRGAWETRLDCVA